MLLAVTLSSTAGAGSSDTYLNAQLATCRAQLSDWVTCPSAKTPAGKAIIARITDKIGGLEQALTHAPAVGQVAQAAAPPVGRGIARAGLGERVDLRA